MKMRLLLMNFELRVYSDAETDQEADRIIKRAEPLVHKAIEELRSTLGQGVAVTLVEV